MAYPLGTAADAAGNVYIADARNARIRVVRPGFQIHVRLGASEETVALLLWEDGVLTLGGKPVYSGSQVVAASGNSYSLTAGLDGGILATFVPETQRVSLAGGEVTLTRSEDGTWRIGDDLVENGHRYLHLGEEHILELAHGIWRLAEYTVETAIGTTRVAADGIAATLAALIHPSDVAVGPAGNVYVSEWFGHRVRKIDAAGVISTFAGIGEWGFSGDGGLAVEAKLNHPFAIATDADGNVYVAEREGHRVRKIDTSGKITTLAGTGGSGSGGDGVPASEVPIPRPLGVAVDPDGNVYVASSHRVLRIDGSGIITTIAGTGDRGFNGDGGPAVAAQLGDPHGLSLDATGNFYMADRDSNRIRRIDTAGVITTFAGTGETGFDGDGGPAKEARLHHPLGVVADPAGNLYVGENGGGRVRRIDTAGVITTFAGTGDSGYRGDGGPATQAQVDPFGVAVGTDGIVYSAEPGNSRVRRIDASGTITTFAGTDYAVPVGGPATEALLDFPRGVAVRSSGEVVFGEWSVLWKLDGAGAVARLALQSDTGNTRLEGVADIAVDSAGNLYVAEQRGHRIRRIDLAGKITPFAGTGDSGTSGDGGPATEARLDHPVGLAVDSAGNVYVAEREGHRVRRISQAGMITTFAGTGDSGTSGDGGPATEARLYSPRDVAVDSLGNLYIADRSGHRIRRVDRSGVITMFADPRDKIPQGSLTADRTGSLYAGGQRQILRIDANGEVATIAGTGEGGYSGDGGPALSAQLSVIGIAVDQFGDVWFADPLSKRVRLLRRQDR